MSKPREIANSHFLLWLLFGRKTIFWKGYDVFIERSISQFVAIGISHSDYLQDFLHPNRKFSFPF